MWITTWGHCNDPHVVDEECVIVMYDREDNVTQNHSLTGCLWLVPNSTTRELGEVDG